MPDVSVVLPTLEERPAFELLHPRLERALSGYHAEVIVVDDDSADGTAELIPKLTGPPTYRLLVRKGVRGLASAVVAGMRMANTDVVVVMDADGSHPPEILPSLIEPLLTGRARFAIASRASPGAAEPGLSSWRRLVSRGATSLAWPLAGVKDPMSGFFAVRRSAIDLDRLAPIGYKIALEILVKCRPSPIIEVPFEFQPRLAGKSKLDRRQMALYLRHLGRLYAWRISGLSRAASTR